jgi:hypothetical protein
MVELATIVWFVRRVTLRSRTMPVIHKQYSTMGLVTLALAGLLSPVACGDGETKPDSSAGSAGKSGASGKGGGAGEGGGEGGAGPSAVFAVDAPAGKVAGSLKLAEALSDVVELGDYSLGFGANTAYLLDFSDPASPGTMASFKTKSAPVAAAFDATRKVAFVLADSGELQAYFVADPKSPSQAASLDLKEKETLGVVRVGDRLFVLGKSSLTPVTLKFSAGALSGFTEEKAVTLKGTATHIAAGGGQLFIALDNGDIDVYSTNKAPTRSDTYSLGGRVVGWVARGAQIFAAVKDVGLKVVDFAASGGPSEIFAAPDVSDVEAFKRSGNLAVLGLGRNVTVAFDVSDFSAPRPLVSQAGALPSWVAPSNGNFVLGSGKTLSVLGVPPFVAASVPSGLRAAFPRYGRIPLQLSKPIDPKTISAKTVLLSCAGKSIETSLSLSPDNGRLTLLPTKTLPAGADCSVEFAGVKDPLGLQVSSPGPLGIQTTMASPGAVESKKSSYKHTVDGAFTDWKPGTKGDYEYKDVAAAQGMYSKFYADFDGKKLHILNDWFYNGAAIEPDCYNQFTVYTGNGSQYWDIRAFGDQHIEVRLNNQLLAEDDGRVTGGYSHTATPNDAKPHTVYEIAVTTAPGTWNLLLSDPGPTFACTELETDPTTYDGESDETKSSVDPTHVPVAPLAPKADRGGSGTLDTLTPTLSWTSGDEAGNFTVYLFELSRGEKLGEVAFKQWVYGRSITLPTGLLSYGTSYTWRVTGYNLAGKTASSSSTFVVEEPVAIVAPKLTGVEPSSVEQGVAVSLSLTGSGFVEGAQAFLDDVGVATTFQAADALSVMLSREDTAVVGDHVITVRNGPDDATTASTGFDFTITAPVTDGCVHSECVTGARLAADCSSCATVVCDNQQYAYCCQTEWDSGCTQFAVANFKSCSCDSGVAGGTGAGGEGGAGVEPGVGGTAGLGGMGGTAGFGGFAGGQDGGQCLTSCSQARPVGAAQPTNFCNQLSATYQTALQDCACSTCNEQCLASACNLSTADSTCLACLSANCTASYGDCVSDNVAK